MAYTIKRSNHIVDDIHLEDNGNTLDITVDLTVDDILKEYNTTIKRISTLQNEIQQMPAEEVGDAYAKLGGEIINLFTLLFGQEQTEEIMEFYGGRSMEMLGDFLPFITDSLVPKINEAQKVLADRYRSNIKRLK